MRTLESIQQQYDNTDYLAGVPAKPPWSVSSLHALEKMSTPGSVFEQYQTGYDIGIRDAIEAGIKKFPTASEEQLIHIIWVNLLFSDTAAGLLAYLDMYKFLYGEKVHSKSQLELSKAMRQYVATRKLELFNTELSDLYSEPTLLDIAAEKIPTKTLIGYAIDSRTLGLLLSTYFQVPNEKINLHTLLLNAGFIKKVPSNGSTEEREGVRLSNRRTIEKLLPFWKKIMPGRIRVQYQDVVTKIRTGTFVKIPAGVNVIQEKGMSGRESLGVFSGNSMKEKPTAPIHMPTLNQLLRSNN